MLNNLQIATVVLRAPLLAFLRRFFVGVHQPACLALVIRLNALLYFLNHGPTVPKITPLRQSPFGSAIFTIFPLRTIKKAQSSICVFLIYYREVFLCGLPPGCVTLFLGVVTVGFAFGSTLRNIGFGLFCGLVITGVGFDFALGPF